MMDIIFYCRRLQAAFSNDKKKVYGSVNQTQVTLKGLL